MDSGVPTDLNTAVPAGDTASPPKEANSVPVAVTAVREETEVNSTLSGRDGWPGMSWLAKKTPNLKEGFMRSKASLEKGVASVATFTNTETKLLMSRGMRKLYCTGGKIEDPEFAKLLERVTMWKASLEAQRRCIRRVINTQRLLEESQKQLCQSLKQAPDNSECCRKSAELGAVVESRVQMLVPANNLQELADQIEHILSTQYVEMAMLRKRYETSKNEADVWMAKIDSSGVTDRLNNELLRATDEYTLCRDKINDLWAKVIENQDNVLCPILLKATGLEGLEEVHAGSLDANEDLRVDGLCEPVPCEVRERDKDGAMSE